MNSEGAGHSGRVVTRRKRTAWRVLRLYFRRFRMVVWVAVLAVLGLLIYMNQVGLPGILKRPLLAELRSRGVDLQFTRLRLSWIGGVVADNVRFGQIRDPAGPQLTASNVLVNIEGKSLLKARFKVESLALNKGHFVWLLRDEFGEPTRTVTVSNIQTSVRLLPEDAWAVDTFAAQFEGAKFEFAGHLEHASSLRSWARKPDRPRGRPRRLEDRLNDLMTVFERIEFRSPPTLKVEVRGDARDPLGLRLRFLLTAPDADTPWGKFSDGQLTARAYPSGTNDPPAIRVRLDAGHAETPWASASDFHLRLDGTYREGLTNLSHVSLRAAAATAQTRWASATNVSLLADVAALDLEGQRLAAAFTLDAASAHTLWASAWNVHCEGNATGTRTNLIPDDADVKIRAGKASSKWGEASDLNIACKGMRTNNPAFPNADPAWLAWTNFHPYALEWSVSARDPRTPDSSAKEALVEGSWQSPKLELSRVHALFPDGPVDIAASLDIATRHAKANARVNFNPLQIKTLLPRAAERWLSQFTWQAPPKANGDVEVTLPPWGTPLTNWGPVVLPTMRLIGQFEVATNGSYRGITATGARSHFSYTNRCWLLPDLEVTRPEGDLRATHFANEVTKQQYWKLRSTLDPIQIAPHIENQSKPVLELLTFAKPPEIEAEIWEWSRQPHRLGIKANLNFGEFSFRGEKFTSLTTSVEYTNKTLLAVRPRIARGTELAQADSFLADFNQYLGFLTNGASTTDPMVVARAIGEQVAKALEPYHFSVPPNLTVNGVIPFKGEEQANLRVEVDGRQFRWLSFNIPEISGNVHWRGTNLLLTKVKAKLYEGDATGYAEFNFVPRSPTLYKFALTTTNTQLRPLIQQVFAATNNIEGNLSGSLVVTHGTTEDWRQWDGYGSMRLRDGLIWDIPVFGVLSPVLNGIAPGLGNSRANSGSFTFNMTNGVLHSSDLEMQASGMRLKYRGNADLHTRVHARVEAELLRDLTVVGPLVSTVFWPVTKMFEYRITGTLGQPVLEPVYIVPKLVLLPFQPFRILRGLFPGDGKQDDKNERQERGPKQ